MFSKQKVHCMICAMLYETNFNGSGGYGRKSECCSYNCWKELEWRQTLAILGKPYHPMPPPKTVPEIK